MASPQDKTDLNPVKSKLKLPFANGVATRKFFGKSKIDNPEKDIALRSNADFIVSAAAGMKVLSSITDGVAARARQSIADLNSLIKESVDEDTGDNKRGNKGTTYSESDLLALQDSFARDVLKLRSVETEENDDVKRLLESAALNVLQRGTIKSSVKNKPNVSSRINKATPDIDFIRLVEDQRGVIRS